MMKRKRRLASDVLSILCTGVVVALGGLAVGLETESRASDPLALAENGRTRYSIVIAKECPEAEEYAAQELAYFLKEMTGARFRIRRDDTPARRFEIVLGSTNRLALEDLPQTLQPQKWEGFAIVRDDHKLFIMGNIPRGALYGVYDFLDVELGIRFLTAEVTHVPKKPTLIVPVKSRRFDPKIEHRTIWENLGGTSMIVRNRMNGHAFYVPMEKMLGGVKWIGPKTHTFNALVPVEKYFDSHPEYFSEIDGQRRRDYKGLITQLCMSNPEVVQIAIETIRSWLGPAVEANPYNKYLVNVSVNDSPYFCKCAKCVAVNKEEGVVEGRREGGTYMRFVNTIATQIGKEYPNVSVETMVYHTTLPKKTRPVSNVIMKITSVPDFRFALDDRSHEGNRKIREELLAWKEAVGDGHVYCWTRMGGGYGALSYLDPRPNLRYIARNIRIMNECGVVGFFVQDVQSRGTEMQDLRYYLTARVLWRPEIDGRETIEEFCRLYYGAGAEGVLRYIDFLHDEYGDLARRTPANILSYFDETYLTKGDAILAEAEAKAETPEIKQRVATCRLPIWKLRLDRAFGEIGKVFSFPVEWFFKMDPEDVGFKQEWEKTTSFDGWQTMGIDKPWTRQGEERRGIGWYGIPFDMPDTKGVPLAIHFGAVDGTCDIFIDGQKVGEQKLHPSAAWCHSFFIPLDEGMEPGRHTMIVRVRKDNYNAGIWKPVSIVDMLQPISQALRTAGERFIEVGQAAGLTHLTESYAGPGVQLEKIYYPKVRFFLKHGQSK